MAKSATGGSMSRTIIVAADTGIGCPKCGHGFPLSEGVSRPTIERHAEEHERSPAAEKKRLEASSLSSSPPRRRGTAAAPAGPLQSRI
jgi:hypothetical protein